MKKPLLIYGAGGLGREVLSLIRSLEDWEPAGFIDDSVEKNTLIGAVKVLGGFEAVRQFDDPHIVMALGDPILKSQLIHKIAANAVYPVLIHPSAILQDRSTIRIGAGSIVTAGCILTTNIRIGNHVIINLNTTIGHDTSIGDYSSVMPGVNIAGEVAIGESVLIGAGSNLINRIRIGDRSKVGMGAAVIRDVAPGITVAGVPAKPI
jgi:sugar O-acyltransferase (sialic acid O-acetyltransferase NeuD family)